MDKVGYPPPLSVMLPVSCNDELSSPATLSSPSQTSLSSIMALRMSSVGSISDPEGGGVWIAR